MASQAFTKALAKRKQSRKLMKKARDAERPDFSMPKIEDGTYIARIKGKVGVTPNKGIPYADFKWVIVDGETHAKCRHVPAEGRTLSRSYLHQGNA